MTTTVGEEEVSARSEEVSDPIEEELEPSDPRSLAYPNWHERHSSEASLGDRVADKVALFMGSWKFIIIQTCIIAAWITGNAILIPGIRWDPYPFIILNLCFSMEATYSAPIIMMSQNRQASRDKAHAEHQYEHQEAELRENTLLTKQIHEQTEQITALTRSIQNLTEAAAEDARADAQSAGS